MEFRSEEDVEKWLHKQSAGICALVAIRSALRAFPFLTYFPLSKKGKEKVVLYSARALVAACAAATRPDANTKNACRSAANAADEVQEEEGGGLAATSAVHAADAAKNVSHLNATKHNHGASWEAFEAFVAAYDELTNKAIDAFGADAELDAVELSTKPLWHEPQAPDWLNYNQNNHDSLLDSGQEWVFWREWYQGFLDGAPLDWELQRRVALIDDAIWEAGPEAVAEEIARIRALYRLEFEIAKLKEQLRKSATVEAPAHRLHNQPPEAVEDEAQAIRREITLVSGEIEALEDEIAKPKPSPSKLQKIARALWDISLRIGKYCGSVADVMVKESAKELSKTGTKYAVRVIVATTAAQNESVQSVAKAIWEFIKTLPPG